MITESTHGVFSFTNDLSFCLIEMIEGCRRTALPFVSGSSITRRPNGFSAQYEKHPKASHLTGRFYGAAKTWEKMIGLVVSGFYSHAKKTWKMTMFG